MLGGETGWKGLEKAREEEVIEAGGRRSDGCPNGMERDGMGWNGTGWEGSG